jgi:hypothetical protein
MTYRLILGLLKGVIELKLRIRDMPGTREQARGHFTHGIEIGLRVDNTDSGI